MPELDVPRLTLLVAEPPYMEAHVQSEDRSRGICGGHSGTGTNVSPKHFGVPINVFPPVLHTKSVAYHQR